METSPTTKVDLAELEQKVKKMYSDVAFYSKGEYHFDELVYELYGITEEERSIIEGSA